MGLVEREAALGEQFEKLLAFLASERQHVPRCLGPHILSHSLFQGCWLGVGLPGKTTVNQVYRRVTWGITSKDLHIHLHSPLLLTPGLQMFLILLKCWREQHTWNAFSQIQYVNPIAHLVFYAYCVSNLSFYFGNTEPSILMRKDLPNLDNFTNGLVKIIGLHFPIVFISNENHVSSISNKNLLSASLQW